MSTGTLKEVADREAAEAEAEAEAAEVDAAPEAAEVDEVVAPPAEPASSHVTTWDRAPTQLEFSLAQEKLDELRARAHEMTPGQVVDALVKVVDVHPSFRMPSDWPGDSEEVLLHSTILADIGRFLGLGCRGTIEVPVSQVVFLWRDKKTWTSRGVEVTAKAKKLSEIERFQSGGVAAVVANFRLFQHLTTTQKVAAIYGALRRLDKKGNVIPPQFEGFFDELHLFGLGTFQADANLARAVERGRDRDEELPFRQDPTLFDVDDEEDDDE